MKNWKKRKRCLFFMFFVLHILPLVRTLDSIYEFYVTEEEPPRYVGKLPITKSTRIKFSVEFHQNFVRVDRLQGFIYTEKKIDREALNTDVIHFVCLSDKKLLAEVNIHIVDLNDNSPIFPNRVQHLVIPESAKNGSRYNLQTAVDFDSGLNGYISKYLLTGLGNGNHAFSIDYKPTLNLELVVTSDLDREKRSNYILTLTAYDAGTPGLSGFCMVNIILQDVNDNAPIISKNRYEISLVENHNCVGDVILDLYSTDEDEGKNGELTYSLEGNFDSHFSIDQNGKLILMKQVDYEAVKHFSFVVIVTDHGTPPLKTQADINIKILDSNDNPPRIKFTFVDPSKKLLQLQEGNIPGKVLSLVTVFDLDSDKVNSSLTLYLDNHKEEFSLTQTLSNDRHLFSAIMRRDAQTTSYVLRVRRTLDREERSSYSLAFTASDGKFKSTVHTNVLVTDKNDNSPVFQNTQHSVTFPSSLPPGSYITTFRAVDQDVGANGNVTYTVANTTCSSNFSLSPTKGILQTRISLNHCPEDKVALRIRAADSGDPSLFSYFNLTINLSGQVSNHLPTFTMVPNNLTITSDTIFNSEVARYAATFDKEKVRIAYLLETSHKSYFHLTADSGQLFLRKTVDLNATFTLKVVAVNLENPLLRSEATTYVRFSKKKEKDNAFTKKLIIVYVGNDVDLSYPVANLNDIVIGQHHGSVVFQIVEGNRNNVVSLQGSFLYVKDKSRLHNCLLLVVNAETGGMRSNASIFVSSNSSVASREISFFRTFYSFDIFENSPIGSIVGIAKLTSRSKKDDVKFFIETGNELSMFGISHNGIIFTLKAIAQNHVKNYAITVTGISQCEIFRTKVLIRVIDLNDHAPVYISQTEIHVPDTVELLSVIHTPKVEDADIEISSIFLYRLLSNGEGQFSIDEATGEIMLLKPLRQNFYSVIIQTSDQGIPEHKSNMVLIIHVNRTLNYQPSLTRIDIVVKSQQELRYPFRKVQLFEPELTTEVSYQVNSSIVGIYPNGYLYLKRNITNELKSPILFNLTAGYIDFSSSTTHQTGYIHIDRQWNSFLFTNFTYRFEIDENAPVGTTIGHLLKQPRYANASLFFSTRSMYFELRGSELRLSSELDRENIYRRFGQNYLAFSINGNATDREESCLAIITIRDVNDNPPYFKHKHINLVFDQDASSSYYVTATDNDAFPNNQIHYEIMSGNRNNTFMVRKDSGKLVLNKTRKFVRSETYNLKILAYDLLKPDFNDTINLKIFLRTFEIKTQVKNNSHLNIYENVTVGSIIYRVKNFDQKMLTTYAMLAGKIDESFIIHPNTGQVRIVKALDYEKQQMHQMNIELRNLNQVHLSDFINLTINVLNSNDNAPEFSTNSLNFYVQTDDPVGKNIGSCSAVDKDVADIISFYLDIDNNFQTFFSLDINSCTISLASELKDIDLHTIEFHIIATDGYHRTSVPAKIILQNNSPLEITSPTGCVVPAYLQPSNTRSFYRITVKPRYNETVTFSLTGGTYASLFRVHPTTGDLFLISKWPINMWFTESTFKVVSSNGKNTMFILNIFKAKAQNLRFQTSQYFTSVKENSIANQYVAEVSANYRIKPSKVDIKYYVTSGQSQHYFTLNENLGKVYVKEKLDRESTGGSVFLTVYALDKNSVVSEAVATTVEIQIIDENDNFPVFISNQSETSIPENTPIRMVVANMSAVDADHGNNGQVSYSIVHGNIENKFLINSTTGMIILQDHLDRELCSTYNLNISASDHGNPMKISHKILTISVTDVNDNSPQFTASTFRFSMLEKKPVNYMVGHVASQDKDFGKNSEIYYSIKSGSHGYLSIDTMSGKIFTNKIIRYNDAHLFILHVEAKDGGNNSQASTVTVIINVLRDNNLCPEFNQKVFYATIVENTVLNSPVLTLKPRLIDTYFQELVTYFLTKSVDNDAFKITQNGSLFLQRCLDREKQDSYEVHIASFANNSSSQCVTSIIIHVTVDDLNDNRPYFREEPMFYVNENTKSGQVIGLLRAFDDDRGNNSLLDYQTMVGRSTFSIGRNGQITLKLSPDYELQSKYTFYVKVCDQGHVKLCVTQRVVVLVNDLNDNTPHFLNQSKTFTVYNTVSKNHPITHLQAFDKDTGKNAELEFRLLNHSTVFQINSHNGTLTVKSKLIANTNYSLSIEVHDRGIPRLTDTTQVSVYVIEKNTPPSFLTTIMRLDLLENKGPISYFQRIQAKDNNSGENGELTYSLQKKGPGPEFFAIHPVTGVLSLLQPVDREKTPSFNLTVQAADSGNPPLHDVMFVLISVLDVNDNAPKVKDTVYVEIVENSPVGEITRIPAYDIDIGKNARLRFQLLNQTTKFYIDPNNGVISTLLPCDREDEAEHTLQVNIEDAGTPQLRSVSTVVVRVADVNDNPPSFSSKEYKATVQPGQPSGSFVLQVSANDRDSETNSFIQFSIQNNSLFSIDENSGILTTKSILPNIQQTHRFAVSVQDPFVAQYQDKAFVTITMQSSNNFPMVKQSVMFFEIKEENDYFMTTPITRINASSPLDGTVGKLSYTIATRNDDVFKVHLQNGSLFLRKMLDYEAKSHHVIWIEVKDSQQPPLQSYVKIIIYVINVNDNPPRFPQRRLTIRIPENKSAGHEVTQLKVRDLDCPNPRIIYSLSNTTYLSINETTGIVYTKTVFDYEELKNFSLKALARDFENQNENDFLLLHAVITNVNDNAPKVQQFYNISIRENVSIGSTILFVQVYDIDGLENISYTINTTVFTVFKNGTIRLVSPLDRELKSFYALEVNVFDGNFTSKTTVHVHILDINDCKPVFENMTFHLRVSEKHPLNTNVYNLTASDNDLGRNAESVFTLHASSASDYFKILPTGEIFLLRNLTIQGKPLNFNLTISVKNTASPFYESTAMVFVNIIDENDHKPLFVQKMYTEFVLLTAPIGHVVTTVHAIDLYDTKENAKVSYFLLSGNGTSIFSLSESRIVVAKYLTRYARQWLQLIIEARDHGNPPMKSRCFVNIYVEEKNQFPPDIFNAPYTKILSEEFPVRQEVLRIIARDSQTLNEELTFQIVQGNINDTWNVLPNGSVNLQKHLDYEQVQAYRLAVQVSDRNYVNQKFATTYVYITVTDVNDNIPAFDKSLYRLDISENFDISKPIFKVAARDKDSPVNSQISYRLLNGMSHFTIDASTGLIKSTQIFDFEKTRELIFVVMATDSGKPPLSSSSQVVISVKGINEFAPRFKSKFYNFTTVANAPVGQVIGQVEASDQDQGLDGICIYISTLPQQLGFKVDPVNGEITVSDKLTAGTLRFEVLVKNEGSQIDESEFYATTTVSVVVENAFMPPKFTKDVYQAAVYENYTAGSLIITVRATQQNNALIRYSLTDPTGTFNIEPETGAVTTARKLDREHKDFYNLTLSALTSRMSVIAGRSRLQIKIFDVNDNSPRIGNCSVIIPEDTPVGTSIMNLTVHDDDIDSNAAPFAYKLTSSKREFSVNEATGEIVTSASLDYEKETVHVLSVVVSDSGLPKLSSVKHCTVHLSDVDDNDGKARNVNVIVNYDGLIQHPFLLGDVSPVDADASDRYICTKTADKLSEYHFENTSCQLIRSWSTHRNRLIQYSGALRNRSFSCSVNLVYVEFNSNSLEQAVIINVLSIRLKDFVNNSLLLLSNYMNDNMQKSSTDRVACRVSSVQAYRTGIYIFIVLVNPADAAKKRLIQLMNSNVQLIKKIVNSKDVFINFDPCARSNCNVNSRCSAKLTRAENQIINTEKVIFHSLTQTIIKTCTCLPGWVGERCNRSPATCSEKPCHNEGKCLNTATGFQCICLNTFTGRFCENDVNECVLSPCQNGGTCVNKYGGFTCKCNGQFTGKLCEELVTPCSSSPCKNNGTCLSSGVSFQCNCQFGDYGERCSKRSINFQAASYLKPDVFVSLKSFSVTMEIATTTESALLMLAYSSESFVVVEIIEQKLVVQLGTPINKITVTNEAKISDGNFHSIKLQVSSSVLLTTVDGTVHASASHNLLGINSKHQINIGGVESDNLLTQYSKHLTTVEFIGCLRKIEVNEKEFNQSNSNYSSGVTNGCKRLRSCDSVDCKSGGECIDLWSDYLCKCPGNYFARSCGKEYQSVKLNGGDQGVQLRFTESYKRKLLLKKSIRKRREALQDSDFLFMQFRTRKEDAILFNSTDEKGSSLLLLQDGKLHYSFSEESNTGSSSLMQSYVADGQWHNVTMFVYGNLASLTLDGYQSSKHTFASQPHKFLSSKATEVWFGSKFEGCLGNVKLNNDSLYLSGSTNSYTVKLNNKNANIGCISTDVCRNEPCENRTLNHCVDQWESFVCVALGMCVKTPCENNGRCVPIGSSSFSCDCTRVKYAGNFCEIPEACYPNPCKPGESCTFKDDQYACISSEASRSSGGLSEKYLIIIVLSVIFILSISIGCFTGRRKWQTKTVVKFEGDLATELKDDPRRTGIENPTLYMLDETAKSGLNRSNLSLPDFKSDPQFAKKESLSRYKSADLPLRHFQSTDDIVILRKGKSSERLLKQSQDSLVSNKGVFTLINPQQVTPHIESGFESTGSDIIAYRPSEYESENIEAYDLDDASMGFSEMSFQYQSQSSRQPSPSDHVFSDISETTYSSGSDSDASFTCSECDQGQAGRNKGRKNLAYVLSKPNVARHSQILREQEQFSDSSSHSNSMKSFSNSESTNSRFRIGKEPRRRRHRQSGSRSVKSNRIPIEMMDHGTHVNRGYDLEKVPEVLVEEYV